MSLQKLAIANDPRYHVYKEWLEERGFLSFVTKERPAAAVVATAIPEEGGKILFLTDLKFTAEEETLFKKLATAMNLAEEDYDVLAAEKNSENLSHELIVKKSEELFEQAKHYKFVVIFGHYAAMRLLGVKAKFDELLNGPLAIDGREFYVTFHPKDMVRYPQHKVRTWNQLKLLKESRRALEQSPTQTATQ